MVHTHVHVHKCISYDVQLLQICIKHIAFAVNHQHFQCVPFCRQALLRCGDDTNKDVDMTGWYIARPRPGFVDGENVVITDATPTPTSGPSGVQFLTEKSFLRHPRCVNLRTCMTYVYVHMRLWYSTCVRASLRMHGK